MYALIDCNSFFVSCEKIFVPHLEGTPVVVLSNNDGCVVSRSKEAKDIGIPMGAPAFKYKKLFSEKNVSVFSANFTLYGDISNRIMKILKNISPDIEIYSIDEAFISLKNVYIKDLDEFGQNIKRKIKQYTGIPISVGISYTKTLAKIANHIAKDVSKYNGVCTLTETNKIDFYLKKIDVGKVWGIGYKTKILLNTYGINTAYKLKKAETTNIKKLISILGEKTVLELRGIACIEMEKNNSVKKSILSSRSFGKQVSNFNELSEAISNYTSRAAQKLREENAIANYITVFIKTNIHRKELPQYYGKLSLKFDYPTSYTPILINHAKQLLNKIYKPNYEYKRAGVILSEITPIQNEQKNLFENNTFSKNKNLMKVIDKFNFKSRKKLIFNASEGIQKKWKMKSEQKSKLFTTDWEELLSIRI